MPEILQEDIGQLFGKCLILYDGELSFVEEAGRVVRVFSLEKQVSKVVDFDEKKFKILNKRIGYVNTQAGLACYLYRNPVRRWSISYSTADRNYGLHPASSIPVRGAEKIAFGNVNRLIDAGIFLSYKGEYPTLKQAAKVLTKYGLRSAAFDKQFAIERSGAELKIWYRTEIVGTCPIKNPSIEDIKFNDGKGYLITLLEDIREKSLDSLAIAKD